jgi:hypothetical protein
MGFGSATAARSSTHHFGGSWEGWTEERVGYERAYVMSQVARGEYVPPQPAAAPDAHRGRAPNLPGVRFDRSRPQAAAGGGEDL